MLQIWTNLQTTTLPAYIEKDILCDCGILSCVVVFTDFNIFFMLIYMKQPSHFNCGIESM